MDNHGRSVRWDDRWLAFFDFVIKVLPVGFYAVVRWALAIRYIFRSVGTAVTVWIGKWSDPWSWSSAIWHLMIHSAVRSFSDTRSFFHTRSFSHTRSMVVSALLFQRRVENWDSHQSSHRSEFLLHRLIRDIHLGSTMGGAEWSLLQLWWCHSFDLLDRSVGFYESEWLWHLLLVLRFGRQSGFYGCTLLIVGICLWSLVQTWSRHDRWGRSWSV